MDAANRTFERRLRDALGCYPTGVAVITTCRADGMPVGVTVNSFSSVSLTPPLVLWSLSQHSANLATFQHATHWAVHVLADDQQAISRVFATPSADRFAGLSWDAGEGGVPLLRGCSALLQCRASACHEGGDHLIFVGEVLAVDRQPKAPLVYHAGRYSAVQPLEAAAAC
jgi:flavin reductase (DIM6/NTAB) family NADH-FMN oxidoreductase RutF